MNRTITIILALLVAATVAAQGRAVTQKGKRTAKPQVGIALSGGGALGFAHIGVLQALNEHGIYPDCVAGTSMGAIIGVMYAAGFTPQEILEIVHTKKLYKVKRLLTLQSAIGSLGMSTHDVLHKTLREYIPHNSFDSLMLPFVACVTNLDKAQAEYRDAGTLLAEYVVASASIPGVFEAVDINGTIYVDGGVLDNLPARSLQDMGCKYIIGVDVLPIVMRSPKNNSIDVVMSSIRTMQHSNSIPGIEACQWVINSYALTEYHEFSFEQYREIYQYGYRTTIEYIKSHPELVRKTGTE